MSVTHLYELYLQLTVFFAVGSLLDIPTHTVNMTTLRSTHDLWQSYSMSPYEVCHVFFVDGIHLDKYFREGTFLRYIGPISA